MLIKVLLLVGHLNLNCAVGFWLSLPALLCGFAVVVVLLLSLHSLVPCSLFALLFLLRCELYLLLPTTATVNIIFRPLSLLSFNLLSSGHCLLAIVLDCFVCPPYLYLIRQFDLFYFVVESFPVSDCCPELIINTIICSMIVLVVWVQEHLSDLELVGI